MHLKELRIEGFKSFGKPVTLLFSHNIVGIVGPNGSGKSNIAEAFRFVLGEQSMKSLRGQRGEDLIFNGGGGTKRSSRASVNIVFDNSDRLFSDAFDEVAVSRTVYRDGANEYRLNGTQVRHQDVVDLLARANIGATNHHIISQGAADRVLNASPEDRKEMLEDGLGLRVLQYRRTETEKKLKKATINIAETEAVLRELTPRLQYLKRQVSQREKARVLREELAAQYTVYLARETRYLAAEEERLNDAFRVYRDEQKEVETAIAEERASSGATEASRHSRRAGEERFRSELAALQKKKQDAIRGAGRCEGELAAAAAAEEAADADTIRRDDIAALYQDVCRRCEETPVNYPAVLSYAIDQIKKILRRSCGQNDASEKRHRQLLREQEKYRDMIARLEREEADCLLSQSTFMEEKECALQAARDAEKALFVLRTRNHEVRQKIADAERATQDVKEQRARFKEELREGRALVGDAINAYQEEPVSKELLSGNRGEQESLRRDIERKKIRLEEIGTGFDTTVYREYEEASSRVSFLQQERQDLLDSIRDCEKGIAVIQKEIDTRFARGIRLVNREFERLFRILFDGGKAGVTVEKKVVDRGGEEPETRLGVAVSISLPHKRVTSLNQLSGGERTLVSVALLFAITQIAPPPFLVLDETDAALDEANSRRYGSMIESLAKKSQLVIITHNRETMHRAGILYGVTMNMIGSSALLSVQFDEALQVAQ